jgi:hypothetical protein
LAHFPLAEAAAHFIIDEKISFALRLLFQWLNCIMLEKTCCYFGSPTRDTKAGYGGGGGKGGWRGGILESLKGRSLGNHLPMRPVPEQAADCSVPCMLAKAYPTFECLNVYTLKTYRDGNRCLGRCARRSSENGMVRRWDLIVGNTALLPVGNNNVKAVSFFHAAD